MDSKKRTQEDLEKSPASEKKDSGKSPPSKKSCVEHSPQAKLSTPVSYKPLLNSDFRIPKKVVKRCGGCSTCKQPPCYSCLNCQVHLKGKGDSPQKFTCSNRSKCLKPIEENGETSPEKAKSASPENKTNNEKRRVSVSPEKSITSSPGKRTIVGQIAKDAISDNPAKTKPVVRNNPSDDIDEQCPFSSEILNKSHEGTKGKEKKNPDEGKKEGKSSSVPISNKSLEGTREKERKPHVEESKEGKSSSVPILNKSREGTEGKEKKHPDVEKKEGKSSSVPFSNKSLEVTGEKQKKLPVEEGKASVVPRCETELKTSPVLLTEIEAHLKNGTPDSKIEYQLSIGERRKLMKAGLSSPPLVESSTSSQKSKNETPPGKGNPLTETTPALTIAGIDVVRKGRKPETPRCGTCPGCLRTENCMDCSNCIKSGNCHKRRCLMKIREYARKTNERKKLKMMAGSQSDSSSDMDSPKLDKSMDYSPKMDGSLSTPIPNCGVCSNCTREDDCGTCNKCSKGKKGCARKICRVKMREAQKRFAMKKAGENGSQLPNNSDAVVEKSNSTPISSKTEGTPNVTPLSSQKVAMPNITPISSKTDKCGKCEGCTRTELCGKCSYCLSDNEKIRHLCSEKRCKNKKKSYKRRKRCYTCEGCTKEPCGDCWVCRKKSSGEKINEICAKKKCVNFIIDTPEKSNFNEKSKTPEVKSSEKKKVKRTRCGECEGCNSGSCGTCVICTKGYPQLCKAKHCTNPIITEKGPTPLKKERPTQLQKETRKRIRCGECGGCAAEPCGECNVCQKTPSLCQDRTCTNPVYRDIKKREKLGRSPGMPKPKGPGMNPRRFKRCGDCNGCKAPDCGECESCEMNEKFGSEMTLGKAACEGKAPCEDPISLFQSNTRKHMAEQEDGTCPTKIIDGKLYDFRCYFCKKLPRVGSANRSELYRHYAVFHYPYEIKSEFGQIKKCHHCSMDLKGGNLVSHMGQKHNEVEKYLPEAARIPLSIQKNKGRNRGHRRGAVVVYKREVCWDFPDIPEGFDPNGENREVVDWDEETEEEKTASKWIIDGFEIEDDLDEDEEPLMVSREDPYTMTDYSGRGASCTVCHSTFSEVLQAVSHLHKVHEIKAGSPLIMLDTDRLLKGGYLNLLFGETETVVKPWNKKTVRVVEEAQGEDKPKKPTARKSTTSLPLEKGLTPIQTNVVSIPSTLDHKASEDRKAKIREAIMAVKAVST